MRCVECGYHSFDNLQFCKKCDEPQVRQPLPASVGGKKDNPAIGQQSLPLGGQNGLDGVKSPLPASSNSPKQFPTFLLEQKRGGSFFNGADLDEDKLPGRWQMILRRIGATVVDIAVLLLIYSCFVALGVWMLELSLAQFFGQLLAQMQLRICYYLIAVVSVLSYFILLHIWCGQTVGKMFFRLQVVAVDGQLPAFTAALLRASGSVLSVLCVGWGYGVILFDAEQRGWNDRVAGTQVRRVENEESELPDELPVKAIGQMFGAQFDEHSKTPKERL